MVVADKIAKTQLSHPVVDRWPYHSAEWTSTSSRLLGEKDRRMEASAYLLEGYGLRRLMEGRQGHILFNTLATTFHPPRTATVLVDADEGTPYLTASQTFHRRPFPRKWIALNKLREGTDLEVSQRTILMTRSGTVGRTTLAFTPHLSSLISDDLLRVKPLVERAWGWVYAYLRAPKTRAMMVSQQYGHVIQHLEASHLRALPVPSVTDSTMESFTWRATQVLELREQAYRSVNEAEQHFEACLGSSDIPANAGETGFVVPSITGSFRLDAAHHSPVVSSLRDHFKRNALTVESLDKCGFDVWVPGRYKRVPVDTGGVQYLDSSDLFVMNPNIDKRLADHGFGDPYGGRVEPGWILMASSGQVYGNIGGAVLATNFHLGKALANHVIRIKPRPGADARAGYVLTALTHPFLGRPLVKSLAFGSSVPEISPSALSELGIPRLAKSDEDTIADLMEGSFLLHSIADAIEGELAFEAESVIDHFIGKHETQLLSTFNNPPHLNAEFARLSAQWYRTRPRGVDVANMVLHPSYQQIIALGRRAVPLILRELDKVPSHWFWALHRITGSDPVSSNDQGNLASMSAAWIKWGKQHGYYW